MNSQVCSSRAHGVYPIFSSFVKRAVSRRSSSLAFGVRWVGGDEETRTPDPLLAKEMLFQLSYAPFKALDHRTVRGGRFWTRTRDLCLIRAVL
jgi:hypothetical protein